MVLPEWMHRTELLLGSASISNLQKSHVLVAGLGGVGAFAAEMLARAGVGEMTLVDSDTVHPTNRNRQLLALTENEGEKKVQLMANRLVGINPNIQIHLFDDFLKDEKIPDLLDQSNYHCVVDAIDTMAPKIFLIYHALKRGYPVISSMGAGGKFDPSQVRVADIAESYNCKLASMLRKRIHRLGVYSGFKVVFSPEKVDKRHVIPVEDEPNKKTTVGTISYMPAIFGCHMASETIQSIIKSEIRN